MDFKLKQKERDDARCMERIRKDCALEMKAAARRQKRFDSRWRNPMQHPKWRKAEFAEIERKVATEWHLHGTDPEAARANLMDEAYGIVSPF
jgi:hypothetical protein